MSRDGEGGRANGRDDTAASGEAERPSPELVDSLRNAIERRDRRIARLEESLDTETETARALRRELEGLSARVDGLERALERRTETCERLRQLLREARGGELRDVDAAGLAPDTAAEAPADERPARATGPYDVEVSVPGDPPRGDTARPGADGAASSEVDDAIESALAAAAPTGPDADEPRDAREFTETVADIPDEMLSPERMFVKADADAGAAAGAASEPAGIGPALVGLDGDPPRRYALDGPAVTLGRSGVADVVIDGRLVSRLHARIRVEDGRATIEDLGSTNGIHVNGERVARAELADGDVIHLGRARFRFESGAG